MTAQTQLSLFDLAQSPANMPAFDSPNFLQAIEALLPDSAGFFEKILGEFTIIGIAEEEIYQAMARHPEQADLLNECFLPLRPDRLLAGAPEHVYRAHCRELLDRAAHGQKLAPGTDAEVCWIFKECSLIAPLNSDATGAYLKCFRAAFGSAAGDLIDDSFIRESYTGRIDEVIAEVKRKAESQWRHDNWDRAHRQPRGSKS